MKTLIKNASVLLPDGSEHMQQPGSMTYEV